MLSPDNCSAPPAAKLWCDGVALQGAAPWFDWIEERSRRPAPARSRADLRLALLERPDDGSLRRMLLAPVDAVIEIDGTTPEQERCTLPERGAGILLSLTTSSAYRLSVSRAYTLGLAQRLDLTSVLRVGMETALQEAVANAVLHGNLGIQCGLDSSFDALIDFGEQTLVRLEDPVLANRRVRILATWTDDRVLIRVSDEGNGYSPEIVEALAGEREAHAPCGRGLDVIRLIAKSCSVTSGGTDLHMVFQR